MRAAAVQREAGVHLDTTLVVALTFRTVQFMSDDIAGDAADLDRSSRVGSEVVVPRRMLVPAVVDAMTTSRSPSGMASTTCFRG